MIGLETSPEPDERGMRSVMCIINGQLRPVVVRDRSIDDAVPTAEKADRDPITSRRRSTGGYRRPWRSAMRSRQDTLSRRRKAMKMEAAITAAKGGVVKRIAVATTAQVEGGDLLVVIADPDRRRRRRQPTDPAFRRRGTRPTTDRTREALFNLLAARRDFDDLRVPRPLHAGSGALASKRFRGGAVRPVRGEQCAGAEDPCQYQKPSAWRGPPFVDRQSCRCCPAVRSDRWTWCWRIRRMMLRRIGSGHGGRTSAAWLDRGGAVVVIERSAGSPPSSGPPG